MADPQCVRIDRVIACASEPTELGTARTHTRLDIGEIQNCDYPTFSYVALPCMRSMADGLGRSAVDRAKVLEETDFFEAAHVTAAQSGQSAVPTDLDVDTHFIAFVEAENDKGLAEKLLIGDFR